MNRDPKTGRFVATPGREPQARDLGTGRFVPNPEITAFMAENPPEPQPFPDEPPAAAVPPTPPPVAQSGVPPKVAAGAPAAETAAGVGVGLFAAQAAVAGIEAFGEAAKSPQGSIAAFAPGGGGGGGQDYLSHALNRSILAALNAAGSIPNRF